MDFNHVYLPILSDLVSDRDKVKRYNVLKGGAGAGKSYAIAQTLYKRLLTLQNYKILAMRKVYNTIRESQFDLFQKVIDEEGTSKDFKITSSPFNIVHIPTGNEIIFGGMDDPAKLKSISGVNVIWLEEADQFDVSDFHEADTRIRGESKTGPNYPYQMFISFNPTSELSWLKSTFFDPGNEYEDESLVISTTFRDNAFIDAGYGKVLRRQAGADPVRMSVMMNGQWGRLDTSGLFYKRFDTGKHMSYEFMYQEDLPLWISWDFNVVPSCTCLVFQQLDENTVVQIDEFQAKSPNNNTQAIAKAFKAKYGQHPSRLYVTGDPSGRQRDTRGEQGRNDYTIIMTELAEMNPQLKVASVAPNQITRGDFINAIFGANYKDLSITVGANCERTIQDLSNQKETSTGKDKKKVKGKVTGETYEQYGHCSDAFDYAIYAIWGAEYEEHKRGPKVFDSVWGKNKIKSKYL